MQLAFSTNAFSRHSLSEALTAIAAAGYAGVEILADKPHWYPDSFDEAVVEKIRSQLSELKLAVSNVNANCTFGYWQDAPPEPFFEPSLISPNPAHRADRIRMIHNTLKFAEAVGADTISITSGKALPTMPPEAAMKQLRESLAAILETAEKLKIKIGIECEPGLFIEYAHELRELIDRLGSKMLGANLDIGHSVVIGESIPDILKLLGGRIWNCHIEDIPHRKHYHLIPGQGTIDWSALKNSLLAIKYHRFLTVELYTYPDRPKEAAEESIAYLQGIFGE
ncbi:MAG: sugar phosphate isomerase/epimerase [Phycisphaerales bacterium]|nr:sugar phosphate isomerase/epimerase [Phycisphaerales bacterium]